MRERILFVELWRLGDATAATAGLLALRAAKPDAEIAIVVHPMHGEPLLRLGIADRVIPFAAFWTRGKLWRHKYLPWTIDWGSVLRFARQVWSFNPDHVILFRGDIREQLVFRLTTRGRVSDLRAGGPKLPGIAYTARPTGVRRFQEYVYHVQQVTGTAVAAAPAIGGVIRDEPDPARVVLHPGASWRFKQWAPQQWAKLAVALQARGLRPVLVGGPGDAPLIEAITHEAPSELPTCFPTLDELYRLIAGSRLVICCNSSALHFSEALGTPCIALTGSADHVRWGTYTPHSTTLVRVEHWSCYPCREHRCVRPDDPCMDQIGVPDVLHAVDLLGT